MWDTLGFRESPYNTDPLRPRAEDIDLLVGRDAEAGQFCTTLDTTPSGVLILSGSPGVGKTSFLNVQQYRLENELAPFGPKILAARQLCPVQPNDTVRTVASRALSSLCASVEQWCTANKKAVPKETAKLTRWIAGGGGSGFEVGISIAGFGGNLGRSVQLPNAAEASFEALADAISAVTGEVVTKMGFSSAVIVLDNLENLEDDQLRDLLVSYRDTLFAIPQLWWILIGQSGLGSLIQSLEPKVFERTTGSIEVKPIELDEFDQAIALRVERFHESQTGKAPLTKEIHRGLYEASFGEMRFVFKYSNSICSMFVQTLRDSVLQDKSLKKLTGTKEMRRAFEKAVSEVIAQKMINEQIPDVLANGYLKQIVRSELEGAFLKPQERQVLNSIGERGSARASDFRDFGIKSMQDFSSNYLSKLYHQKMLVRQQEGRAVNYRLRGIAQLSYQFGLLST